MPDLNSLEKFNQYYKSTNKREFEKSLKEFFDSHVRTRLEADPVVLDLGAGSQSLFEETDLDLSLITAIDFSAAAIENAQGHSAIDYQLRDITKEFSIENMSYDLIFDSHCLHCIVDFNDRKMALKNIHNGLKATGLFCAEMMVKSIGTREVSSEYKHIPEARKLEEELLQSGFKIIYFMIVRDLNFLNGDDECDLLRVIGRK
jgi:SAM-dependent methyltransferase